MKLHPGYVSYSLFTIHYSLFITTKAVTPFWRGRGGTFRLKRRKFYPIHEPFSDTDRLMASYSILSCRPPVGILGIINIQQYLHQGAFALVFAIKPQVVQMLNSKIITRLFSVFFLSLAVAAATSCSSEDFSPGSSSNSNTGSVALLLTDAPSDIFEEINITVVKAELLSDGGHVTIFEGERTFNLLDLTDARIFAIRDGIPAGTYSKIRLTLSDIELVDYKDNNDPADDAIYHPKLPANGKLDLKPHGTFSVVPGSTLTIQIDMDANKSIHIVKKDNKDEYKFRPVVFIDIVTDGFVERYVKLQGNVTALDPATSSFKLCNTNIPVQISDDEHDTNSRGCIRVVADASTSLFNTDGSPADFGDLVSGRPATVFGRLQRDDDDEYEYDDKAKGKDDDDDDEEREMDDLVLKAALIEIGPATAFQKLNGSATSAVDVNNVFSMDVAPGQGLLTPLNLNVQIQQGTLLINRKGAPVASSDIATGKLVSARGVLDVVNDTLFASLIVVDTDSSTQLVGTVGDNPDNVCGFALMTSGGDRSVASNSNTRAYMVTGRLIQPHHRGRPGPGTSGRCLRRI